MLDSGKCILILLTINFYISKHIFIYIKLSHIMSSPDLLESLIKLCLFIVEVLVIYCYSTNVMFFYFPTLSFFFFPPPPRNIFYSPMIGDSIKRDNTAAKIVDQKISEITWKIPEYGSQYISILLEKVPLMITIKWTK